ncbi:hypothetical protein CDAR_229361 [Caerostris darwini]|uniref:Uncharacterized protein n=1 Tax=Caerostris darwini TaxID=1538125 RepID=A0AAV4TJ46_9ARAC|nr:hypothetical protein CDAR_229361 [Caerostris darwini]
MSPEICKRRRFGFAAQQCLACLSWLNSALFADKFVFLVNGNCILRQYIKPQLGNILFSTHTPFPRSPNTFEAANSIHNTDDIAVIKDANLSVNNAEFNQDKRQALLFFETESTSLAYFGAHYSNLLLTLCITAFPCAAYE